MDSTWSVTWSRSMVSMFAMAFLARPIMADRGWRGDSPAEPHAARHVSESGHKGDAAFHRPAGLAARAWAGPGRVPADGRLSWRGALRSDGATPTGGRLGRGESRR